MLEICNRWSIAIDRDHVIGHREIYARKTCPGTWIDLDDYVARVRRLALDPPSYNFDWYRNSNGEFFWAGATTGPVPA